MKAMPALRSARLAHLALCLAAVERVGAFSTTAPPDPCVEPLRKLLPLKDGNDTERDSLAELCSIAAPPTKPAGRADTKAESESASFLELEATPPRPRASACCTTTTRCSRPRRCAT